MGLLSQLVGNVNTGMNFVHFNCGSCILALAEFQKCNLEKLKDLVNWEKKQLILLFSTKCFEVFFKGTRVQQILQLKRVQGEKYLKKINRLQHLDGKEIDVLQSYTQMICITAMWSMCYTHFVCSSTVKITLIVRATKDIKLNVGLLPSLY